MMGSRLLKETVSIAENAALGKFPCLDAVTVPDLDKNQYRSFKMSLGNVEAWEKEQRLNMVNEEKT